jgi:hypothetical protein
MMAQSEIASIFSVRDINASGKPVTRCSRCEGLSDIKRGKSFQLQPGAITKAKEHITIHCPEIRPEVNSGDASLRHCLLINMSAKHVASMSQRAQLMRKFLIFYCLPIYNTIFIALYIYIALSQYISQLYIAYIMLTFPYRVEFYYVNY